MKGKLTRKKFLELTTKGAIGTALAVSAVKLSKAETKQTWPYPYQQLDPEYVRKLGHQGYWTGKGCAYGAFNAIVKALAEKIGNLFHLSQPIC
jgi:hypothetical protein